MTQLAVESEFYSIYACLFDLWRVRLVPACCCVAISFLCPQLLVNSLGSGLTTQRRVIFVLWIFSFLNLLKTLAGKTSLCQFLEANLFPCLKPCLDPCSGLDWQPRTYKLISEFVRKKPFLFLSPLEGNSLSREIASRGKKPLEAKISSLSVSLSFWKSRAPIDFGPCRENDKTPL